MDQIRLYNILTKDVHLTEEKAADFISAIGTAVDSEMNNKIQTLATKEDIRSLDSEMNAKIQLLATKEDFRSLDQKIHSLDLKIEQTKSDLHKAIYTNGIVQFIAIVGSVLAIVKFMH